MSKLLPATVCFALLVACAGASHPFHPVSLRKARGVQVALYNELTGESYLKLHYEEFSKRPSRIGFLKVGLPILTFHELSLDIDIKQANAAQLLAAMAQAADERSARFFAGDKVELTITSDKRVQIKVSAKKARLTATGLRFFEGVEISRVGKAPSRCKSLQLQVGQETNSLILATPQGEPLEVFSLPGNESQALGAPSPKASDLQAK